MPHIIVKLYPGRTEDQKTRLAAEITKSVMAALNSNEKSISVGIEEVQPGDWADMVYKPDILNKQDQIYKGPGYNPFE